MLSIHRPEKPSERKKKKESPLAESGGGMRKGEEEKEREREDLGRVSLRLLKGKKGRRLC